jgi:very-short-patch-repair endonuclease
MWRRCRTHVAVDGLAVGAFFPVSRGERLPHPDLLHQGIYARLRRAMASGEREQKRHFCREIRAVLPKLVRLRNRCWHELRMSGAKTGKTNVARRLRRNATIAEQRLCYRLRSRSLYGMKFVRQEPIGPYIVDFVCRKHRLVIEVDGGQHSENKLDVVRDRWLREHGYRVLRFWNNDVIQNIDGVLETIASALPHDEPAPSPPLGGEGWGEGGAPQAQTSPDQAQTCQAQARGTPPSSRPSPPKGGEGERCGEG